MKVWGRGGRAKDARGLVMELNAAAGRGEDPQVVLRRGRGGPGSHPQPSSLSQRPQARDHRIPGAGMRDHDNGRDFSSNASQLRFAEGAEELRSLGRASWARSGCFVPAGLASDGGGHCGGGGGDATVMGSWSSGADGTGQLRSGDEHRRAACLENTQAGGVGCFGAYREHADTLHPATTWQQASVQPTGGGGRGGSRWGVFASDRASQGLGRHQGPDQQVCGHAFGMEQHSGNGTCLYYAILFWRDSE